MKKSFAALIILLCLLLPSCRTGESRYGYGDGRTPEEIQLSLEILLSDAFGMAESLSGNTGADLLPLIPASTLEYSGTLPLYDELEKAYLDSILSGMDKAVRRAIELFEDENMPIPYTYDYINEKSLTGLMRETLGESVREKIESELPVLFPGMEASWQKLETECTILRKNYENLGKVTEMETLPRPEPISGRALSSLITDEALDALSYAEEYLRNRPLTEHSERSYQIFWEEY